MTPVAHMAEVLPSGPQPCLLVNNLDKGVWISDGAQNP